MRSKHLLIFSAILSALLLAACAQLPEPVSSASSSAPTEASTSSEPEPEPPTVQPEAPGILEQIDALYAELDTAPIPQIESRLWSTVDLAEGTPDYLPPQLVMDEPKSYQLAQQIRTVLYPEDNMPSDFDNLGNTYLPGLMQTAVYHTAPLDINWNWNSEEGVFSASLYQDHVVAALIKHELQEGRNPTAVISGDDVRATMRELYGIEDEIYLMDAEPYYYYAREDVFLQMGDWGGPMWRYPQITSYKESENGVVVEAVLIYALDRDTPLEENGVALTSQNFATATAKCPKYQYTFQRAADDDRLILTGMKLLRAGTN